MPMKLKISMSNIALEMAVAVTLEFPYVKYFSVLTVRHAKNNNAQMSPKIKYINVLRATLIAAAKILLLFSF